MVTDKLVIDFSLAYASVSHTEHLTESHSENQ